MTDEEKFIESLYEEANENLKEIYKEQKVVRDELLQEIALIMLTYTIIDGVMSINKSDKDKACKKLLSLIVVNYKNISKKEVNVLNNILESTVGKTFKFYNYNADLKDVRKIIDNNFKGKHFSKRVWNNEKNIANHLHKQIKNFVNGEVNVNQIKKDIEKTFNTSAYNAKRLVTTEVSRCQNEAFRRLCEETNVKKVKRNAILDSRTCDDCYPLNGKVYELKDMPQISHPMCRCFYEVYE